MTTKAKILRVPIADVVFDPGNANKMPDEDFAQLVANIKQIGDMLQPVLVQELEDGKFQMVDGEHRTKAAHLAGLTHVLGVEWDGTPEMRKALALGFNKIRGEQDLTAVQRVLNELRDANWSVSDMLVTGYKEPEINDLLSISTDLSPDDIMEHPIDPTSDDTPANARPLVLELTFATKEELGLARRGLRRAAGKGHELGEGLLKILGHGAS